MNFVVDVAPRFNYARAGHEVALTPHGALFRAPDLALGLSTRCPLQIVDGRDVPHHMINTPTEGYSPSSSAKTHQSGRPPYSFAIWAYWVIHLS